MQPRDRLSFSPITKRPALRFPSGIRLVVWPVLALEEWDISRPMARTVISPPQGQPQLPDMPNWSRHKFWGKRPRGWFGPGLTQTYETLDYLAEAGVEYIGDWVLDDEPVMLKTTHGSVVALPYNFELHDIVMMALQHHPSEMMYRRALDHFTCLYEESAERAKIMAIACHPIFPACRTGSDMSSAPSKRF